MKLNILEQHEEPLLSRVKIVAEVNFSAAVPSKKDVKDKLAQMVKIQPELVVVKHIYPDFGTMCAKVLAYGYKDVKLFDSVEVHHKKKKAENKDLTADVKEQKK